MSLNLIKKELKSESNSEKGKFLQGFFKTGKGQYAEGDIFVGITVPVLRSIAKKYQNIDLKEVKELLSDNIHEYRLTALEILVFKYEKGDEKEKSKVVDLYLKNTKYINNWDLVDLSASYILGDYLLNKDREILYKLAQSKVLWEKRIAIISTHAFIRNNDFKATIKLAEILMNDKHDLMHKAVGWMLREIGKKSEQALIEFLDKYYTKMPRTMLRYAIERFPENKRREYLKSQKV